jgi:hypothetical protein
MPADELNGAQNLKKDDNYLSFDFVLDYFYLLEL